MDDATRAILSAWNWRLDVLLPLLGMGGLFTLGWLRLRGKGRGGKRPALAVWWRPVIYWLGIVLLLLALVSPIDVLGGQLFGAHMVQHLLLGMFAPPLLMAADPMPIIMWGLPMSVRKSLGRALFNRNAPIRPLLTAATQPAIIFFLWMATLWGWHDRSAYNAALRSEFVHDIEHFTFFITSVILWWHIAGAGPRFHKKWGLLPRAAYAIAGVPVNMAAGIVITFSTNILYTYYESVPRLWGIDILTDQQIGGVIMWVPGSMMYLVACLILVGRWLAIEGRKPPAPIVLGVPQEKR